MYPQLSSTRRCAWLAFTTLVLVGGSGLAQELASQSADYQPTQENLAAREQFQDDKFGIFIHWGVYSVLGRGEWVMNNEQMSVAEYEPLADQFNPTNFDADQWCRLFKRAGANYVTITAKHHDGFGMWDSQQTDWDIVDRTPYGKDVLKQLAEACQRHGLTLNFYYSQLDWHHPEYYPRGMTGRHSERPDEGDFDKYIDYMNAQLAELLGGDYGQVGAIWFDGWWDQQSKRFEETRDAPPKQTRLDWRLDETYSVIHRLQPACLIGANHHVAPFAGEDFQMFERDLPGQNTAGHSKDAEIGNLPLETCDTINRSWGYNAGDDNFKSTEQLIGYLVRAAGNDANFLLNVGPRPDGTIDPESVERLEAIGDWLDTYGQSVYGTRGGPVEPQEWGVSTVKDETVYLHVLELPATDEEGYAELSGTESLKVGSLSLLAGDGEVEHRRSDSGTLAIRVPDEAQEAVDVVLVVTLPQ